MPNRASAPTLPLPRRGKFHRRRNILHRLAQPVREEERRTHLIGKLRIQHPRGPLPRQRKTLRLDEHDIERAGIRDGEKCEHGARLEERAQSCADSR